MARMVPFPMLPTESSAERRLYEFFLEQLPDEYVVYHSVDWVLAPAERGGAPLQGEADFLMADPVDGLLVIEVKGGELSYDPDAKRWTQTGHSGSHRIDDPFHQARDEMFSLVEILEQQKSWPRWRPSYGYAVAFPDGLYTRAAHPAAPTAIAIDRDDLDHLSLRIREIMTHWRRQGRRFGSEGMELANAPWGCGWRVERPSACGSATRTRPHPGADRRPALRAVVPHEAAASGGGRAGRFGQDDARGERGQAPGGGWNSHSADLFQQADGDLPPGQRVRHRRRRSVPLPRAVRSAGADGGAHRSDVPAVGRGEVSAFFERDLPALLTQAAAVNGPRYGAIVVDEAQDFHESWWPALLSLHTKPKDGPLFVFADDSQNLYGGGVPEGLVDMQFPLPANLRNTQAIHEFVSVFHEGPDVPPGRGPAGRPVEVLGYRDTDELSRLLSIVLKNLVAEQVPVEDIVVLTPARTARSELRTRGGVEGFEFSEEPDPGKVLTCTVHGFKGLERPVVILAELSERHREDLARYLYVGGSRARSHLIVLAEEPVARELRQLAGVTGP